MLWQLALISIRPGGDAFPHLQDQEGAHDSNGNTDQHPAPCNNESERC